MSPAERKKLKSENNIFPSDLWHIIEEPRPFGVTSKSVALAFKELEESEKNDWAKIQQDQGTQGTLHNNQFGKDEFFHFMAFKQFSRSYLRLWNKKNSAITVQTARDVDAAWRDLHSWEKKNGNYQSLTSTLMERMGIERPC